jgi:hypothetical protein
MGDRPQAIINKQVLADCDLLVAVFWTRIGSPTGSAASGTVEEIEEHLRAGKPAMLYFSSAPVRPDSVNEQQYAALKQFKQECYKRGLVESYESLGEFRDKFTRQLAQTIIRFYPTSGASQEAGSTPLPPPDAPPLGEAAMALLIDASADRNGVIMRVRHTGGLVVKTNERNFVTEGDPRSVARWEGAVQELEWHGLIQDRGFKREVYNVTDEGYRVADIIRAAG